MVVEFGFSNRWSLTTGSVEEEACSSSDRCSRPINARAAEEFPGSVTVGQLAEARTETGSSETITRLVGQLHAVVCLSYLNIIYVPIVYLICYIACLLYIYIMYMLSLGHAQWASEKKYFFSAIIQRFQ
jgi:hypothetical protein